MNSASAQILAWARMAIAPRAPGAPLLGLQDAAIFSVAVAYLFRYAGSDIYSLVGDNIAQVGYWYILLNPELVGSLGSSAMKPGLIFLLGITHELSGTPLGPWLLKLLLATFAGLLTAVVARIASQAAGRLGGITAAGYLMFSTPLVEMTTSGTSMVFFLPLLLVGIWLFSEGRQTAGLIVLCLATLVRIEGIAALAWLVTSEQLFRRRFGRTTLSAASMLLVASIFVVVFLRIQGDVTRFNAGGAKLGYLFEADPSQSRRIVSTAVGTVRAVANLALRQCLEPSLAFAALLGFWFHPKRRYYLSITGIALFLMSFAAAGAGPLAIRYFEFVIPLVAAFGAAGLSVAPELGHRVLQGTGRLTRAGLAGLLVVGTVLLTKLGLPGAASGLALVALLGGIAAVHQLRPWVPLALAASSALVLTFGVLREPLATASTVEGHGRAAYSLDALDFIQSPPVPRNSRVLIDDDVIYGIISRDPGYASRLISLQYFNVQAEERRRQLLLDVDYIVVSKRAYGYHYLAYDPHRRGELDPFRRAIQSAVTGREPGVVYGQRLHIEQSSDTRIVLKVIPLGQHPGE